MDRFLEEADGGIVIRRKICSLTRIVLRLREGERERLLVSRGVYTRVEARSDYLPVADRTL